MKTSDILQRLKVLRVKHFKLTQKILKLKYKRGKINSENWDLRKQLKDKKKEA